MANYRRDKTPGGWYFLTLVTYQRKPIFADSNSVLLFKKVLMQIKENDPFNIIAIVILPEHIHMIIQLPDEDSHYSRKIAKIKREFGKEFLEINPHEVHLTESNLNRKERGIWQRRFWEHKIRNQDDLKKHIDYIHINPVKHGDVQKIADWKWSSFLKFVRNGYYQLDLSDLSIQDIKGAEWDS